MPGKSGILLDDEGLTALVGKIYDAALQPGGWDGVLRELREITNSSAANLLGAGQCALDAC